MVPPGPGHSAACRVLAPGAHDVAVEFRLASRTCRPARTARSPCRSTSERSLVLDAAAPVRGSSTARSSSPMSRRPQTTGLPAGWVLSASAFNWTPEMIAGERDAVDIAVGIVEDGLASVIEAEPGQLWRSFPSRSEADAAIFGDAWPRPAVASASSGASLDDWSAAGHAPHEAERLAFLLPQIADRAPARRCGRAAADRPGRPTAARTRAAGAARDRPHAVRRDPGSQTPDSPQAGAAIDQIAGIDDPHVRLLVDICDAHAFAAAELSRAARGGGRAGGAHRRAAASSGATPPRGRDRRCCCDRAACRHRVHTLYMNLLVRFGRSDAAGPARRASAGRRVPPEVLGSRRRRRPRLQPDPRPRRRARGHRLHRHALQRVGRARVARRRPRRHDASPSRPRARRARRGRAERSPDPRDDRSDHADV